MEQQLVSGVRKGSPRHQAPPASRWWTPEVLSAAVTHSAGFGSGRVTDLQRKQRKRWFICSARLLFFLVGWVSSARIWHLFWIKNIPPPPKKKSLWWNKQTFACCKCLTQEWNKSRESVTPAAVEKIWPVEALHDNWMKHKKKKNNLFLISSANIFPSKLPETLNKVCAPDFLQVWTY